MSHTGSDPETIDTGTIPARYAAILDTKTLTLGGRHRIVYAMDKDMVWRWDQVLKTHPNGMRFSVFGENGDLLATNEYFRYVLNHVVRGSMRRTLTTAFIVLLYISVGGGFVVNEKTKGERDTFTIFPVHLGRDPHVVIVDENLFYKGVDKSAVHGARLHQPSSPSDPASDGAGQAADPIQPPYPFVVRYLHSLRFDIRTHFDGVTPFSRHSRGTAFLP